MARIRLRQKPRVRFTSEMFYSKDGTLCMDVIQDALSPCDNISPILTSIQQILRSLNFISMISRGCSTALVDPLSQRFLFEAQLAATYGFLFHLGQDAPPTYVYPQA
ncbi:hypothetical protein REPUB_Repub09cG0146100 [Reevesia pubescens]